MVKTKFSGPLVVMTSFFVIFVVIGFGVNTAGVFLKTVSQNLQYGKAAFSLVLSISAVAGFVNSILAGQLLRKFDAQKLTLIYLLITALGTFLYSRCTQLHHFYLNSIIVGIGTSGCTMLPLTMIAGNWFIKKRATAISIIIAGNGIGGFVFNPLAALIIRTNPLNTYYGYQSAYIISSLIMLCICVPLTAIFLKSDPKKLGQMPDGDSDTGVAERHANSQTDGIPFRDAVRNSTFFLLCLMVFCFAVVYMGTNQHLFVYLTEVAGIAEVRASFLVGMYMAMTVVGILVFGRTTDRLGLCVSFPAAAAVLLTGLILFGAASSLVILAAALCLFGFGNLVHTVVPPIMTTHCFGKKDYSGIYGILLAVQSAGIALGPLAGGLIYDKYGNYDSAFYLALFLITVAGACGLTILNVTKKPSSAVLPN